MDPIENFVSRGLGSDTTQRIPSTPYPPLYIPSQLGNLRPNLLVSQVGNPSHPPVRYYTFDGSTYRFHPMNLAPQFISTQDSHNVSCSQDTSNSIHFTSSVEISSPTKGKKRKSLEKGEDFVAKKEAPNKKWKAQHSEVLIPYLVDLASQGFKCFKTFKSPAFKKVADHVNQICNETYTPQNMENHLRSLKEKWKIIFDVRKLSGAGWDEETKTIILDEEIMKKYIEKHPKHKSFINTPIPHYEDLKIIYGEDNATDEFMGTAFDEDLARDIPTVNIDNELSTEEGVDAVLPQLNRGAPLPLVINRSSIGRRSSRPSSRAKNEEVDHAKTLFIKEMKEGLEHIADDITRQGKWLQRMVDCLWQFEGFEPNDIEAVVVVFAKDEVNAKSFIAMPLPIKYKVSSMLQQMGRMSSAQVDSSGTSNSQNSLD